MKRKSTLNLVYLMLFIIGFVSIVITLSCKTKLEIAAMLAVSALSFGILGICKSIDTVFINQPNKSDEGK